VTLHPVTVHDPDDTAHVHTIPAVLSEVPVAHGAPVVALPITGVYTLEQEFAAIAPGDREPEVAA
jgi:hypothetical protein